MKLKISVVIPNYNGSELLKKNLPPLLHQLDKHDEILVVDDASTDSSVEVLTSTFPEVRLIRNYDNKRFQFTCNRGVKEAKNPFVLLLNSDVRVLAGCIKEIKQFLSEADENLFAVGLAELDKQGKRSGRAVGRFERGLILHNRAVDQLKTTTLWTTGGSMVVRKSIWMELGGFDLHFSPAYEEDREICYRALKRGYTIQFLPTAEVLHDHKTTNLSVLGKRRIKVASTKNMYLLHWKNLTDPKLILLHILWLPYHLILGSMKTKGVILQGWIHALFSFWYCVQFQRSERKFIVRSDQEVLEVYGNE